MKRSILGACCILAALAGWLEAAEDAHPFILWTKQEAAAIRHRVENEPWAKAAYEKMRAAKLSGDDATLTNLLRYSVMGEREAGEIEKRALLANLEGRQFSRPVFDALRYDVLYDLLDPDQRRAVEQSFREAVLAAIEQRSGHSFNHINWLPNLVYPPYLGRHVQAVALRDRELARKIFHSDFGLKWYIGWYLRDSGFYNEEFLKNAWAPTPLMLYGRACARLGWDEIGFGFRGPQGASIRGHLESYLRIGYPRVDLGTERPHYPLVVMGDCKNKGFHYPAYGLQQALVAGSVGRTPAEGETTRGALPIRLAFEMGHAQWPEAGFGYFLAQMREPDQETYRPSLLFGLAPIDPRQVRPPAAPSGVYPQRGLAVLRAEEGPEYWESPAPAVAMRLATPYCHHVQDCFSLLGLYGFNRPLLVNRFRSTDYSGVDPFYSNSPRSHSTVLVDFADPKTIGEVPTRHAFSPLAKFFAARGRGIFEGVDQTRALLLTGDYLLDVFHLASDRPRHYQWFVQTLGHACPDRPRQWAASQDLAGSHFDVARERSCATDQTWSVTAVQSSGGAHRTLSGLGERWFQQRIGLRTTMLGEAGTTAYTAWSPVVPDASGLFTGRERFAHGEDEPAGVLVAAARKKETTTFVAVHEPFRTAHRIAEVRKIAQRDGAMLIAVTTPALPKAHPDRARAFADYLMLRLEDRAEEAATLGDGNVQFTFAGYAYVRHTDEGVAAAGGLRSMRLPLGDVRDCPMTLNGKPASAQIENGCVVFGQTAAAEKPAAAAVEPLVEPAAAPIAARWLRIETLCLPAGGRGTATLRLRNNSLGAVTAEVVLHSSGGLLMQPAAVALQRFAPGAEIDVEVAIDAAKAAPNRLHRILPRAAGTDIEVQPAELKVANGVAIDGEHRNWGDPAKTIYAPRYVARFHYLDSGGASLLLDPLGLRRTGSGNVSFPMLARRGQDAAGREGWQETKVPGFAYFIPAVCPGENGQPALVYEAGRHAHGRSSSVEHWFTEDWIVVRYRRAAAGERIAFNWDPGGHHKNGLEYSIMGRRPELAQETLPGKLVAVGPDGKPQEVPRTGYKGQPQWPKTLSAVVALFVRPDGYEYGSARFYPPDSRVEGKLVSQAGDQPMALTFCTEEEFPRLLAKWQAAPPPAKASQAQSRIYGGGFGAHLETPEP